MPDTNAMIAHSREALPAFYEQVEQAFVFLSTAYRYKLLNKHGEMLNDFRDARVLIVYLGDTVEVDIIWTFSPAIIDVCFIELQTPGVSPAMRYDRMPEKKDMARLIRLPSLAAVLGHSDDPDFLLGDIERTDGRSVTKRFKLLQNNMAGVIEGLARATEHYASGILQGDTSLFPQVMAYYTEQQRVLRPWL